jgi:hypothetical protein
MPFKARLSYCSAAESLKTHKPVKEALLSTLKSDTDSPGISRNAHPHLDGQKRMYRRTFQNSCPTKLLSPNSHLKSTLCCCMQNKTKQNKNPETWDGRLAQAVRVLA